MCRICRKCSKEYCENINKHFGKLNISKDGLQYNCKYCLLEKRHTVVHIKEDNTLLCTSCNNYFKEESFDINTNMWYRKNKDRRCKICKLNQRLKRTIVNRGDGGIEKMAVQRFCGIRDRVKKIKHLEELDFDKDYLIYLWNKQNKKCALSNIEMTTKVFNGRTPTNMSVDRIDPSRGYTKNNIQLVCMAVNQMKSDLTYEHLLFFCKNIVNNEKIS